MITKEMQQLTSLYDKKSDLTVFTVVGVYTIWYEPRKGKTGGVIKKRTNAIDLIHAKRNAQVDKPKDYKVKKVKRGWRQYK